MNMKSLKYLAVVGVMAVSQVDAQNVNTYAGVQYTDSGRFLGTADNPKNTELYSRPNGIAVDNNGRIWVATRKYLY